MKRWANMLWLIALLIQFACAGANLSFEAPEVNAVDTTKTLQLMGRGGIAHGCPVDGIIFTAAHVAQFENDEGIPIGPVPGYAFSTEEGGEGYVKVSAVNQVRDIAVLSLQSGDVSYYKLGATPEAGDTVYWREYDFEEVALAEVFVETTVEHIVAGHVVTTDYPNQGASGGCLFNEEGEVIGIVVWSLMSGGVSVSITGVWHPFQ